MVTKMFNTHTITFITLIFAFTTAQIGFEEPDTESEIIAEYVPGKCAENQLLYRKTTARDDGFCDCGPGFIYHTAQDKCFLAYRQGPCKIGEYLVLNKNKQVVCQGNQCKQDGMVKFKGRCYQLEKSNGCPKKDEQKGVLKVNATTIKVECIYGDDDNVGSVLNLIQVTGCPPGSKRAVTGECRKPH